MTPIPRAIRAAAAAALLTLCAGPAATAAPTNQPTRVTTGLAINTNSVVKLPAGALYWPTQTNYFHRATVTNLTVSTITGVDATEVAVADSGNYFTGTNAETVLQELGASVAAAVGDLTAVQVSGGLLSVSSGTGPVPTVGLTTSAVRNATAIYLPLAGGAMTGPLTGALTIQDAEPALFLAGTADDQGYMSLSSTPGSYPANLGLILGSDTSAAQDRAAIYMVAQTSTRGKMVFQTANNSGVLTNALTLDYDQSATFNGAISGNGSGITNVPLATATGTLSIDRLANGSITSAKLANNYLLEMPSGGVTNAVSTGLIYATDGTQHFRLQNNGTVGLLGQAASAGLLQFYQSYPAMNGSAITALNAGNIASGTVPTARLGSGTADSTTYLRGDQTWATVSAGIAGSTGGTDNLALRADGAGGATLQSSDLLIGDASTSTANNLLLSNNHSGQTNSSLGLAPKGTGAFFIGPRPDGTSTGGNARGNYAVDMQMTRNTAAKVASGASSAIGGGDRNTASGTYSCVPGGYANTASGNFASLAFGWGATASGDNAIAFGNSTTASHANSFVVGLDTSSGPSSDRAEQLKFKGDGGFTLQNATGTLTHWGKWTSAPSSGIQAGDVYYDTGTNKMRCYDGTAWNDLW